MQRRLRKKWVVGGAAAVAGAAILYKLYYSERVAKAWRRYQKLSSALNSYNQAFLAGAEVSAVISKDLQEFFQSDSKELPQSLRQLAHLCQATETQAAARSLATATAQGMLSAANVLPRAHDSKSSGQQASEMLDRILGLLVSDKGQTLVTLAVSVASRTSTQTYCECIEQSAAAAKSSEEATGVLADSFLQQLLRFASTPEGERLCMLGVKNFTVNATEVYCEKLEGTSFWEDLFSALSSKPEHKQVGSHMTRCFTNELVNSWLKPSSPTRTSEAQHQHTDSQASPQEQLPGQAVQDGGKPAPADAQATASFAQNAPPSRQQSSLQLQARTALPPYWKTARQAGSGQGGKQEQQQKPWYQMSGSAIVKEAIKVMKVPEGRMMLLSLSAIAVAEGIQTGYHGVKQMCTDSSGQDIALIDGGKVMGLSLRQLYAGLSVVVMLMLYVIGQRASLQPM